MENFIGIIPARFPSSRFPGKPLCDICGKPMIWHVYNSVMKWPKWKSVYVATDSKEVVAACSELGIPSMMTKDTHTDCLDRAAEVANKLEKEKRGSDKYIIIQGDEPLFNVETLNTDLSASVTNFYTEVHDQTELYDVNAVKVVISNNKRALYFSRYTVPYHDKKTRRSNDPLVVYKQIGVYVFTGEMLNIYTGLKPSYLEKLEGIGLNRLLENDIDVFMRYTPYDSISVDTPNDQQRIIKILEKQNG
ncbi:MAG: 3-deoxy-manno-octulosonate cytidylyltransferase [Planctomycetes bacterium ADurb.Bin401]|nr:MAG: 3-deoxy-manno-octulosonate cytidylyltransferase [Planctomycetes bacterium ADurb.Bin401]